MSLKPGMPSPTEIELQASSGPFLIEVALRIFVQQKLLTKVERMMQREQDLPLSFFVRDCHEDSGVPF